LWVVSPTVILGSLLVHNDLVHNDEDGVAMAGEGKAEDRIDQTKRADPEDTKVEEPVSDQVRHVPGDEPTERPPQGSVEAGGDPT
jgi:hypothetical protein